MKIATFKNVRRYELTYLVSSSLTSAEATKIHDGIEALVKKYKGTVISKQDLGKKGLAYAIKHAGTRQTEALYTFTVLELPTTEVAKLDKDLNLSEDLMRYLLVVAETVKPEKTSSKEA